MMIVRKILDEKAESKIYTVPSSATVFKALQVMREGNTGAVLVTEGEKMAWVDLGNIVIADDQAGLYASLQVGF
jgi:hypothetical protein